MTLSLHIRNICKELFEGPGHLQDTDVVELVGGQATGKSSLLQELMITCLIPPARGGCGCGVLYFDLDYHFDLLNVASIMQHKTGASEEDIKLWLKNLYLVRCESTEQVVITLHSLETLFANSKVPFGMIILDSISSFYWIDHKNGNNQYDKEKNIRKCVDVLKKLKERYRLCILASCQTLVQPDNKQPIKGNAISPKAFLSPHWQSFVKYQFLLSVDKNCKDSSKQTYCAQSLTNNTLSACFVISEFGVEFVK